MIHVPSWNKRVVRLYAPDKLEYEIKKKDKDEKNHTLFIIKWIDTAWEGALQKNGWISVNC